MVWTLAIAPVQGVFSNGTSAVPGTQNDFFFSESPPEKVVETSVRRYNSSNNVAELGIAGHYEFVSGTTVLRGNAWNFRRIVSATAVRISKLYANGQSNAILDALVANDDFVTYYISEESIRHLACHSKGRGKPVLDVFLEIDRVCPQNTGIVSKCGCGFQVQHRCPGRGRSRAVFHVLAESNSMAGRKNPARRYWCPSGATYPQA